MQDVDTRSVTDAFIIEGAPKRRREVRIVDLEGRADDEVRRQVAARAFEDEIEKLSQNTGDGASAEVLDALRTTQTKLAQEQARYEIAFRQDLAALADQLRRGR